VIANCLHHQLPALPSGVIVTAAPTTAVRVRQRGYDQARLIARHVAKKRNLPYLETLRRTKNTRQVGSNRAERFIQLENAFTAHRPERIDGKHLLVIDDVLTTGATLESAARTLKMVGAATVDAAVFAHQLKLTSSSSTKSDSKSGR
ncbi:MAG: ComF family protein, partial [Candidatus Saccharimonadales bacterium]